MSTNVGKIPSLTEAQKHALGKAVEKAFMRGWDGTSKGEGAPALTNRGGYFRVGTRAPLPTIEVLERKGFVKYNNKKGGTYILTVLAWSVGEAECKHRTGVDPKVAAAERRAEEEANHKKEEDELKEVAALFCDISCKPSGKGTKKTTVEKLIMDRAAGSRNACFDLDELLQIGRQL